MVIKSIFVQHVKQDIGTLLPLSLLCIYCVRRRRTLPNRHVTAGCYVNSRFSMYVAFASLSCFLVYVAFASLSCGDLVQRTRVCGITVHSAASDRL